MTHSTERLVKRRAFAGIAAGAAAAVAIPEIARAAVTGTLVPSGTAARAAGRSMRSVPTAADWTALAAGLAGPLVRPGDASYGTARQHRG